MKAVCWNGTRDVRVETVPDPEILNPRDIILKTSSTAICGSDLHLYNNVIPTMKAGDILGHEFMGEVVEVGKGVSSLKVGDRVVVPFNLACGGCFFCQKQLFALCDNSNPNAALNELMNGYHVSGLFGYTHAYGGFAGGQAEFVRVPYGDVGPMKVPHDIPDQKLLFLTDIFPTGWMAAENCQLEGGETVAVWGCGPVGQFVIRSLFLQGAARVIAIDHEPDRLELARQGGAEILDYTRVDLLDVLKQMTGGRGPDACVDAVGMEAHGWNLGNLFDLAEQKLMLTLDRCTALRQAIMACRKGGHISIPGVYAGFLDKLPMGAAFGKGLTFKMGQTHTHRYLKPLFDRIVAGEIDPSFIISEEVPLADAPEAYQRFRNHEHGCIKFVLKPEATAARVFDQGLEREKVTR